MLPTTSKDELWVVLHTRPRCEKKVVQFCEQQAIPVYLPLKKAVHRYGGRERCFFTPLFPGYVFCSVSPQGGMNLRRNKYVANVLAVIDQQTLIQQLQHIDRALDVGDAVEVMPYLKTGRWVRVRAGPLKGLEGRVKRIKGKTRVVLNVDMIQQALAVEVESIHLAPG